MSLLGDLEYIDVEFVHECFGNPPGSKMKMLKSVADSLMSERNPSPIKFLNEKEDKKEKKVKTENVEEKEVKKEDVKDKMVKSAPKNKMIKSSKTKTAGRKKKTTSKIKK